MRLRLILGAATALIAGQSTAQQPRTAAPPGLTAFSSDAELRTFLKTGRRSSASRTDDERVITGVRQSCQDRHDRDRDKQLDQGKTPDMARDGRHA